MGFPFMQGQLMSKNLAPITLGGTNFVVPAADTWYNIRNNEATYLNALYTPPKDCLALIFMQVAMSHSAANGLIYLGVMNGDATLITYGGFSLSPYINDATTRQVVGAIPLTAGTPYALKGYIRVRSTVSGSVTILTDITQTMMLVVPFANP